MKKLPKVGLLLLVAALVLACGSLAAAQDLIKVGIVNLPPEESGYRQANVEDMNRVFSREN
ncbi:MAG TPA: sugar ABC transporter substrate-binding protein, partial [Limnochordia bacterium]|nr:sugar ABC transporter substrate-binding protein [Limnochordia bacterium]